MQIKDFINEPTGRKNHPSYDNSIFTTVAPEYSIGEVLLGSTYRGLLFMRSEREIDLQKIRDLPDAFLDDLGGPDLWRVLLAQEQGGLASPVRGGQRTSRLPQLMPLVPQIAYHACVLGRVRSRWTPWKLLLHVIGGGVGETEGNVLIKQLGDALRVEGDDDIFARFVALAFNPAIKHLIAYPYQTMRPDSKQLQAFRGNTSMTSRSPAERFCKDLEAILQLKGKLTRRQWTVLLEAVLRVGLSTYVLWICHINTVCWQFVLSVTSGTIVPSVSEVETAFWQSHRDTNSLLEFGHNAEQHTRQLLEKYVYARFGLNLLFYLMEEAGCPWPTSQTIGYSRANGTPAPKAIKLFLEYVSAKKAHLDAASVSLGGTNACQWLRATCATLLEDHSSLARCQSGFTSNILEFARYSLGQVETEDSEKKSYDQAYLLANLAGGRRRKSLWIAQPGPAMLISLVHACCYAQGNIPATIEDFRSHLADYGLRVPTGEFTKGRVGTDLENLGLVIDSPDAAGGRLLVDPFFVS